jgi:ABC-type branched-subunit amino acid transport system ATPase component
LIVEQLKVLFGELRGEGTSLLLVEEKLRVVEDVAEHLAFLRLGRITWAGPVAELDRAAIDGYYLGTPDPTAP